MGISPFEFYAMTPAEYYCKKEGYERKKQFEYEILRQQTFQVVSPYMKENATYGQFKLNWPMYFDEKEEPNTAAIMTREQQEEMIRLHNEISQKAKARNG